MDEELRLNERDIWDLMLGDDLLAFVVPVLFVIGLELLLEGYVFTADRDRVLVRAEFVVLNFFWFEPAPLRFTCPERLDIREFPVGLARFFPTDDRMDFPDV